MPAKSSQAVKHQIDEIHRDHLLPNGLRIVPFYDRIELITAALNTVYKALLEGIVLVVVVLFLFLGNVRSALVVTATLIVTPLATFIVMDQVGLTANLMSLGGLVIAIGMMVDGSVVVVENVYRLMSEHHGEKQDRMGLIVQAVKEVGQPVIFGILIIILVFLPILSLQGMEGKMFQPLAYSIMIALLVSLIVSLTLSPVLCFFTLQRGSEEDTFLVRWSKRLYLPALTWALGIGWLSLDWRCFYWWPAWGSFRSWAGSSSPSSMRAPSPPRPSACPASRWKNRSKSRKKCSRLSWNSPKSGWWYPKSAEPNWETTRKNRMRAIPWCR